MIYEYWDFLNDEFGDYTVLCEIDDAGVLETYWDSWCEKMSIKYPSFKRDEMDFMSKSQCVEDWLATNHAWVKK